MSEEKAILFGVGTGPGDPELMTVKAVKALEQADVVAYFAKKGNIGNARKIVDQWVGTDIIELPLYYPLTTELDHRSKEYQAEIDAFFDTSAVAVRAHLDRGRKVAILSIGDPLFYGSYMHLHIRLKDDYPTTVIPGITAMSGCWSLAGVPVVQGEDVMAVLPGTMDEDELVQRLKSCEGAVIMKVGRNLPKIKRALEIAGKLEDTIYVERGTMEGGKHMPLSEKDGDPAPYFSLLLVPGWNGQYRSARS